MLLGYMEISCDYKSCPKYGAFRPNVGFLSVIEPPDPSTDNLLKALLGKVTNSDTNISHSAISTVTNLINEEPSAVIPGLISSDYSQTLFIKLNSSSTTDSLFILQAYCNYIYSSVVHCLNPNVPEEFIIYIATLIHNSPSLYALNLGFHCIFYILSSGMDDFHRFSNGGFVRSIVELERRYSTESARSAPKSLSSTVWSSILLVISAIAIREKPVLTDSIASRYFSAINSSDSTVKATALYSLTLLSKSNPTIVLSAMKGAEKAFFRLIPEQNLDTSRYAIAVALNLLRENEEWKPSELLSESMEAFFKLSIGAYESKAKNKACKVLGALYERGYMISSEVTAEILKLADSSSFKEKRAAIEALCGAISSRSLKSESIDQFQLFDSIWECCLSMCESDKSLKRYMNALVVLSKDNGIELSDEQKAMIAKLTFEEKKIKSAL